MNPEIVRVLVVDDDRSVADTLVAILRLSGFEAIPAYSADDARFAFKLEKPDLVFSDVILGDGNGADLAVEFHRIHPQCRILLFSGQVNVGDLRKSNPEAAEFPLLSKPLHPKDVVRMISGMFEHSRSAQA